MTNRVRTRIVLSVLALAQVGCGHSEPSPTAPSPSNVPVVPQAGAPVYTLSNVILSGMVFEETANGRVGIAGADVYCEPCGADTHTWALTDANGLYHFTGVWTNPGHFPTRISVGKSGYVDPAGIPTPTPPNPSGQGWREVVVIGDTRFDMQLVRQ